MAETEVFRAINMLIDERAQTLRHAQSNLLDAVKRLGLSEGTIRTRISISQEGQAEETSLFFPMTELCLVEAHIAEARFNERVIGELLKNPILDA